MNIESETYVKVMKFNSKFVRDDKISRAVDY